MQNRREPREVLLASFDELRIGRPEARHRFGEPVLVRSTGDFLEVLESATWGISLRTTS
jgi:hypothetical protein